MSTAAYTPITWVNNTAPELAAGNLNHAELGIKAATDGVRALESVLVECEVYADSAQTSATNSATSATNSQNSAVASLGHSVTSQSWAVGGTGTRTGEDTNNSKHWSDIAKEEADRAAAVSGVDIATESVAGLIKASSEIVVGIDGAPTLKQTDTSGLVGTAGLSATLQSLINYIADAVKTKLVKISDLANNLTTTASGLALDARQGKVLNDSLTDITNSLNHSGTFSGTTDALGNVKMSDSSLKIVKISLGQDYFYTPFISSAFGKTYVHVTNFNGTMLATGTPISGTYYYID